MSKKYKNKVNYALFLYVIHLNFPTYEDKYDSRKKNCCFSSFKYVHNVDCGGIYRHLMGNPSLLCMDDLDILWLCFYASGNTIYSNQVKTCALFKKKVFVSDAVVKTAAEWSFNNHVAEKFIDGPIISSTTKIQPEEDIMEKYRDE